MTAPVATGITFGEQAARRETPGTAPVVSLIIPTFNEAGNIAELLAQLDEAMPPELPCEILFVDDSTDATPAVIADSSRDCRLRVSVRHRDKPEDGLGGAVAEGLRAATAAWVVVMDADLQHPPSLIPELIATGDRAGADLVVATRYASGGGRDGLDGGYRRLVSGMSTWLTRAVFRRELRSVSDPMSGFFAVRAAALEPGTLRPLGYKILLELIVRGRIVRVAEVPFQFRERFAGTSKASLKEGWRFLQHLVSLRFDGPRGRVLAFGLIGLSGFVPNLAALWLLTMLGVHYLAAEVLANQVAIAWNFLLLDLLLFRHRRRHHWSGRLAKFLAVANIDLIGRIPLLGLLVAHGRMNLLLATAITLVAGFAFRFAVTDRFIYLARQARHPGSSAKKVRTP